MPEAKLETPTVAAATASVRIIAAAIVIAGLYYASSIVITLICAILIAFVLEPGVLLMEKLRMPRWVGSLIAVVSTLAVMYLVGYVIYDRVVEFLSDLPKAMATIQRMVLRSEAWFRTFRANPANFIPNTAEPGVPTVRLQQESPWAQFLPRGIGSVYAFTVTVMFIPFLVFFMLTSKNHLWAATLNLFPAEIRQQTEDVIDGISRMVRRYVLGNLLLVLISAALITPVFAAIELRYALLVGPLAAFLSLVPYIGVALGILPALLIALVQFDRVGPFLVIALTVMVVHFLAVNILTPKLVGRHVGLNALSVTLSMMFWGSLWGGIGLVLSVPITAAIKAVCDNVRSLKPIGDWMGEG